MLDNHMLTNKKFPSGLACGGWPVLRRASAAVTAAVLRDSFLLARHRGAQPVAQAAEFLRIPSLGQGGIGAVQIALDQPVCLPGHGVTFVLRRMSRRLGLISLAPGGRGPRNGGETPA